MKVILTFVVPDVISEEALYESADDYIKYATEIPDSWTYDGVEVVPDGNKMGTLTL